MKYTLSKPGEIDSLTFELLLQNIPEEQIQNLFLTIKEAFPIKRQRDTYSKVGTPADYHYSHTSSLPHSKHFQENIFLFK